MKLFQACRRLITPMATGGVLILLIFFVISTSLNVMAQENSNKRKETLTVPEEKRSEEAVQSSKEIDSSRQPSGPSKVDLTRRVTLDLRNMDVIDALKYIALRSGMNIVTSKNVTGSVSFQVKDVPIHDILDITLLSNNLAYEKIGEIYYVMTEKEYEGRRGRAFSDARKVKIFHLKYAIPQKAFDLLDTMKSSVGRILVDQESGTVMIMDTPEKIEQMDAAVKILEEKSQINVFHLDYAAAKDVQEQLKPQLDDKNIGSIRADERSNQVIVRTLPERMNDIERIIKSLDKKTKEVLIDAKIIKVKLSDTLAKEFEWEGLFKQLTSSGVTKFLGSHPLSPVFREGQTFVDDFTKIAAEANPPPGSKKTFTEQIFFGRAATKEAYEILIKFLQTLGETKLISNPKLAVVNKQEARIHIGRKEAYITTTTTTGQTTTTTAEQVTFVDVGIQLAVTPIINEAGYIILKIKPEVSSVVDILTTPSGNKIPIVDTSTAETTVMVKDRATIIIGGLRREDEVITDKRIPFLASIPILGHLFSSKNKKNERSELLVMITPRIIEGNALITGDENQSGEMKNYKDYEGVNLSPEEELGKLSPKPYRD